MQTLRTTLLTVALAAFAGLAAQAETVQPAYDPVARAIALGLTPESYDARFDRALAAAESCDAVAQALQTLGCGGSDVATLDTPSLPPLAS
jgi:hypothetical protein